MKKLFSVCSRTIHNLFKDNGYTEAIKRKQAALARGGSCGEPTVRQMAFDVPLSLF